MTSADLQAVKEGILMSGPQKHVVVAPPALLVEVPFLLACNLQGELEELGLQVMVARNAEEAMPWACSAPFCLAYFGAPSIGDAEAALAVELRRLNGSLPVIAAEDCLRSSSLAPVHLLKSPIRPSHFRGRIIDLLGIADTDQSGTTIRC